MQKFWRTALMVAGFGGIVALSLWFGLKTPFFPVAASGEAELSDELFRRMAVIAGVLFCLVQGALLVSMVRFRQRPGDNGDGLAEKENVLLEFAWTAAPVAIVLWLSIASFDVYNVMHHDEAAASTPFAHHHMGMATAQASEAPGTSAVTPEDLTAPDANTLRVEVQGMQYAWIFSYPGTEVTTGELHVPVGRRVRLDIHASDVIHSFWVPQLRIKQDAVPGMDTHLEFTPTVPGEYPVVCAELCGSYHGGMRTQMIVHTVDEFGTWLQTAQAEAQVQPPTIAAIQP
ncbi:MAG TPA: cytochrome c oxidase subunit II [Cyanobacteria bacterium UBA8156]|nr:cytochrome c oxidase subunit II [Cyanobacteria bacterium UBA8156]